MELQFQSSPINYLRRLVHQKQPVEQTQELRLPDGMPDIGSVLGCWGQVILRSKQWNSSSLGLSAGVMVWILYSPEDGSTPCSVEVWVPFQQKFDLPDTQGREGTMHCAFQLTGVDARSTSARKLFIRVCVDTMLEAMLGERTQKYFLADGPEDIQLLENTYPMLIAMEAGEKSFEMDETLTLPGSCPSLKKLISYKIYPKVQEKKVLADKVVFRGIALIHMLYLAEDDLLYSWDFDVPFSQFGELEREYESDAAADVRMVLTSGELQPDEQGALQLQFGLVGQYTVYGRIMIPVIEDAYSTTRNVEMKREQLPIPSILERQEQTISAQQLMQTECLRIADASFCCRDSMVNHNADTAELTLNGQFQILCYDMEGKLTSHTVRWEQPWSLKADQDCNVYVYLSCEPTQALLTGGGVCAENELTLDIQTVCGQTLETIAALTLGEVREDSQNKPSLILCRAGKDGLWPVAKSTGSTVEAIRKANKLEQEPSPEQFLLIPINR